MESVNCACELNLISQIEFWKMHKMQRILLIYLNHMHCQFEIIQILSTYSMIETKKKQNNCWRIRSNPKMVCINIIVSVSVSIGKQLATEKENKFVIAPIHVFGVPICFELDKVLGNRSFAGYKFCFSLHRKYVRNILFRCRASVVATRCCYGRHTKSTGWRQNGRKKLLVNWRNYNWTSHFKGTFCFVAHSYCCSYNCAFFICMT